MCLYSGWIDVDVVMLQVRFCDTWNVPRRLCHWNIALGRSFIFLAVHVGLGYNMVSGIKPMLVVIMLLLLSSGWKQDGCGMKNVRV